MTGRADCQFRDRAVYFESLDALVLADLHVGRAHASEVAFPVGERTNLRERLQALLSTFDPETVVLAGDLLHSFDHVPAVAQETLDELAEAIAGAGAELLATPGNHDPQLPGVLDAPTPSSVALGDVVVAHGHQRPEDDGDDVALYVVGHDHPAIEIEGQKRPTYLYGDGAYRGADVLMLPAFTELAAGVTINRMYAADFDSPLVTDAGGFRPVVRDEDADETLWFPPLSELRPHL